MTGSGPTGAGATVTGRRWVWVIRVLVVGVRTHVVYLSRSPLQMVVTAVTPLLFAMLAVYLFRASDRPGVLLQAAVAAGMMRIWTSVVVGAGHAIQQQRWMGVLESLVAAPSPLVLVIVPITLASAVLGAYSLFATVFWGVLLFDVELSFAHPVAFFVGVPVTVLALGMFGLLLAGTFVLLPNANALSNALSYPVWTLSGMLVSLDHLPDWTWPLSAALPSTWGMSALRAAIGGGDPWTPMALCLTVGVVHLILGTLAMAHVERRARADATLALA